MIHAFVIELLWLFSRPEERHGFPDFIHRDCLAKPPLFSKRLFGAYLSHLIHVPFGRTSH